MSAPRTPTLTGAFEALRDATVALGDAERTAIAAGGRVILARSNRRRAQRTYDDMLKRVVDAPYKRGRSA